MQNDVWHEVMRRANFGCVYLKIVAGKDVKPNDYIFLYVNPAFEKMTGLRKDMLIGKRAAEVLLNPGDKLFDWDSYYSKVNNADQKAEFTQYLTRLKKWYRITAFLVKEDRFVSIFQDVTQEMEHINALEENEKA